MGEYCAIDENGSKPKKKKSKGSLGESFAVIRSSPKVRRGGGAHRACVWHVQRRGARPGCLPGCPHPLYVHCIPCPPNTPCVCVFPLSAAPPFADHEPCAAGGVIRCQPPPLRVCVEGAAARALPHPRALPGARQGLSGWLSGCRAGWLAGGRQCPAEQQPGAGPSQGSFLAAARPRLACVHASSWHALTQSPALARCAPCSPCLLTCPSPPAGAPSPSCCWASLSSNVSLSCCCRGVHTC